MSLFQSLNLARLSLAAHQTAIQTVGQNIANASTEGYARQRVQLRPTPADDLGFAQLGTGVSVVGISRVVNTHLEETLRDAGSELSFLNEESNIYSLVESVFNDANGGGLSNSLNRFFAALEDYNSQPQDTTVRNIVIEEAQTLTDTLQYLDSQVRTIRSNLNQDVVNSVDEINRLTTAIADLNHGVVQAEAGGVHPGSANDLRTQRDMLLTELSEIVEVTSIEDSRGAVQVLLGSDALVVGNRVNQIGLSSEADGDVTLHSLRFESDGKLITPTSGKLGAFLDGRDRLTVELRSDLNSIAESFLTEFNRIHSSGEGLEGNTNIRSQHAVVDRAANLSAAGYPFQVEDGSLTFQVINQGNGTRESYRIDIDTNGGFSLEDFVNEINTTVASSHPEINAQITTDGYLEITSSSSTLQFTFREDTSGLLEAAGINGLFTGTSARDIALNQSIVNNANLLASGRNGLSGDSSVIAEMISFRNGSQMGAEGRSVEQFYEAMVGKIGIEGREFNDLLLNQDAIHNNIQNQRNSLSGVSVDEEAIKLVELQRAYQGSARFLSIVDQLLSTLINL